MSRGKETKRRSCGQLQREMVTQVLNRDGWTCQLCGSRRDLQVHHLRFRSQGGDDTPTNLLTLCRRCHAELHARRLG